MLDRRQVIPRLIKQRPDPGMLECDRRALRIMLVIRVRQIPSSSDLIPLSHQSLHQGLGVAPFGDELVTDHKRG